MEETNQRVFTAKCWACVSSKMYCAKELVISGVVPANQTKESEVRELSGRSPELVLERPFACEFYTKPIEKGGSGTNSGLLLRKFADHTFFGMVCRNYS